MTDMLHNYIHVSISMPKVGLGLVQQKTEMVVTRTSLESFEGRRLTCADIVIDPVGCIHILTSTSRTKDPIRLHKLQMDVSASPLQSLICTLI